VTGGERRGGDLPAILLAIHMLVATGEGGTYTLGEMADALKAAGFVRPGLLHKADDMSAAVRARKPK